MSARQQLDEVKTHSDIEQIKQAIKTLEATCENYVARRMNSNIKAAMQGHSIDEYASDKKSAAKTEES
jgi:molecular chaperone HscA